MSGLLVMIVCLWSSLTLLQTWVEGQPDKAGQSFHLAVVGQPIAGISYEKALVIHFRHIDELSKLSGGVSEDAYRGYLAS